MYLIHNVDLRAYGLKLPGDARLFLVRNQFLYRVRSVVAQTDPHKS
jgi:hypothetical protein